MNFKKIANTSFNAIYIEIYTEKVEYSKGFETGFFFDYILCK